MTDNVEPIQSLQVATQNTLVRVDGKHVEMWNGGYHARRSVPEWIDLVKASVTPGPVGTFVCPICAHDEPHSHSDIEQIIERVARPTFESFMHRQFVGRSAVGEFFKRGYWLANEAEYARKDGGWAERESPTGAYKYHELQAAWALWQASWFAIHQSQKGCSTGSSESESGDSKP